MIELNLRCNICQLWQTVYIQITNENSNRIAIVFIFISIGFRLPKILFYQVVLGLRCRYFVVVFMHPTSQIVGIHLLFRNLSQALYEHSTRNFRQSLTVILQQVFMGGSTNFRPGGGGGGPDDVIFFIYYYYYFFFFLAINLFHRGSYGPPSRSNWVACFRNGNLVPNIHHTVALVSHLNMFVVFSSSFQDFKICNQ